MLCGELLTLCDQLIFTRAAGFGVALMREHDVFAKGFSEALKVVGKHEVRIRITGITCNELDEFACELHLHDVLTCVEGFFSALPSLAFLGFTLCGHGYNVPRARKG